MSEAHKELAWAHKEATHGVRRDASGARHLAGLSIEESEFLIDYEARMASGGKDTPDDQRRYLDLYGRYNARSIGDYVRKREGIIEH